MPAYKNRPPMPGDTHRVALPDQRVPIGFFVGEDLVALGLAGSFLAMSMSANGRIRESASTASDAIFLWKTHTGTAPSLITYTLHQDSLTSVDDPSIC